MSTFDQDMLDGEVEGGFLRHKILFDLFGPR